VADSPYAKASEQSPSAFLPGGEGEETHQPPAESEVFHGNQKQRLKAYKFKK
jgi:hypothetical protein